LEASYDKRLFAYQAFLAALARLPDPPGYPGDPWQVVVQADPRMITDGISINYGEAPSFFQRSLIERGDLAIPKRTPARISREEARSVYRFRVSMEGRKGFWREIEIQGEYPLHAFDRLLRELFKHGLSDHMSSFTKRISRGKGKRPLMVELAVIDPSGEGKGADTRIAALELAPGDQLIYVYDFGDWFEHHIELKQIAEHEAEVEYPRIVGQNQPRYKYCEACAAEGARLLPSTCAKPVLRTAVEFTSVTIM
jgi:hypothetical protein